MLLGLGRNEPVNRGDVAADQFGTGVGHDFLVFYHTTVANECCSAESMRHSIMRGLLGQQIVHTGHARVAN